jgi:hypothetical protein
MLSDEAKLLQILRARANNLFVLGSVILALWSLLSFVRAAQLMATPDYGGVDFHAYWYAGLFIRQAQDPYAAFFAEKEVASPLNFLDKDTPQMYQAPVGLSVVPANTAPIALLLTPLAWFSWPTAKTIWFIINIILALLLPWLAFRALPDTERLAWTDRLLAVLAFYAMTSTRRALDTGQTTLLILSFMVGALLLARKNWAIAGIMLGIALSKYSVALPVFLFFFYQRQFRLLITALIVQFGAVLSLAVMTATSPLAIVESYQRLLLQHLHGKGIHLGQLLPSGSSWQLIVPALGTLLLLAWVGQVLWVKRGQARLHSDTSSDTFYDWHILTILSLWTLLVVYHRLYDIVLVLFFLILIVIGFRWQAAWRLLRREKFFLSLFAIGIIFVFILPGDTVMALFFPQAAATWADLLLYSQTGALLCALALSVYLWLYHLSGRPKNDEQFVHPGDQGEGA